MMEMMKLNARIHTILVFKLLFNSIRHTFFFLFICWLSFLLYFVQSLCIASVECWNMQRKYKLQKKLNKILEHSAWSVTLTSVFLSRMECTIWIVYFLSSQNAFHEMTSSKNWTFSFQRAHNPNHYAVHIIHI